MRRTANQSLNYSPQLKRNLLLAAIVIGIVIRTIHFLFIDINKPFVLGGLYYEFAVQIAKNNFTLPVTIPYYSSLGIAFAYPPLAFYIEAIFVHILPKFPLANVLPPLFSCISLIAFSKLAKQYFSEYWHTLAAILIFALLGSAFSEQIEGAGLVESLGTVWLVGITYFLIKPTDSNRDAGLMGLFTGLGFITSPGLAFASVVVGGLYVVKQIQLRRDNLRVAITHLAIALGVALILILPYVLPVISYHGLTIFTESLTAKLTKSGGEFSEQLLRLDFMGAYYPWLWQALFVSGGLWAVATRRWILLLFTVGLMLIPQEGTWMSSVPMALLLTGGTIDMIGGAFKSLLAQHFGSQGQQRLIALIIAFCILFSVYNASAKVQRKLTNSDNKVSDAQLEAMAWITKNTPQNGKFLVFSTSSIEEWAPEIIQRTVLNNGWGQEWQPRQSRIIGTFGSKIEKCDADLRCSLQEIDKFTANYPEIFIVFDAAKNSKINWPDEDLPTFFTTLYRKETILIVRYIKN